MSDEPGPTLEWRRPFLVILAVVVFVVGSMSLLDMGPETLLVAALISLFGVAFWTFRQLAETAPIPVAPPRAFAPPRAVGADSRVRSLRHGILFGQSMSGYNERVMEALVEIVDDQLLHEHGVDRATSPALAADIMGAELTAVVTAPPAADSIADPKALARIVTLIEQI